MNEITPSPKTPCAPPTLNPSAVSGPVQSVNVTIQAAQGDHLYYTLDCTKPTSGPPSNGTLVPKNSVNLPVPCVFGRTLKAIACDPAGLMSESLVAKGEYGY